MFAPFEVYPGNLETVKAFKILKSLRKHDAMRVLKTWVNLWATSSRHHEAVQLPCLFGCTVGADKQTHYVMCPILFCLTVKTFQVSEWPLERLGLSSPSVHSLRTGS